MNDETGNTKTFKTFRDLKTIPQKVEADPPTSVASNTSTPSSPSNTSISGTTSRTSTSRSTSIPGKPKTTRKEEVSPVRDFQKIPNSITRDALPQGTFKGKSKHVYDYLWSVSRGAIQPTRVVKKSRREIKQGSGLGSMVTVDAAIEHLERIGLIKVTATIGSLTGNQYEIFAPGEVEPTATSTSSISSTTSPAQKVDILVHPESSTSRRTQIVENNISYDSPKTIFKTLKQDDDDSPLAQALKILNEAAKRATGKDLGNKDFEALEEIIELIIAETDLAANRTRSVSVYTKLAAENLRRRLYSKPKQTKGKPETTANWSTVGKFDGSSDEPPEEYVPEPLTEETRRNALVIIRGMLRTDTLEGIQSLAEHYVPEDWEWLMNNLRDGFSSKG